MAIRWQFTFHIAVLLAWACALAPGRRLPAQAPELLSRLPGRAPELLIGPKLNDELASFDGSLLRVAYRLAELESEMVRSTGLDSDVSYSDVSDSDVSDSVVVSAIPANLSVADDADIHPLAVRAAQEDATAHGQGSIINPPTERPESPSSRPVLASSLVVEAVDAPAARNLPAPAGRSSSVGQITTGGPAVVSNIETTPIPTGRQRILFQPAVPAWDEAGNSILRPAVQLADAPNAEILPTPANRPSVTTSPGQVFGDGRLPIVDRFDLDGAWVPSEFVERARAFRDRKHKPLQRFFLGVGAYFDRQNRRDAGIGVERLPFAIFEMNTAQPGNSFRLRYESAYDWEFPDRVEYFWARIGRKGPPSTTPVESSVDYQELRLSMEVGGPKFSATTDIPLRLINPTVHGNTGGLGDMAVTTKTVMIDNDALMITHVMRNQLPTGTASEGRGNGHVSMEQGIATQYRWRERTLLHNELKLWFPLGGEPGFSGPVFGYGFGFANLLYDSDAFAVIPTLEFVGWSVLNGQQTAGTLVAQINSIDGLNIVNIMPGVRLVRDSGGEVFEIGFSGGTVITSNQWYQSLIRMDLRWTF